jgi:hypothetical protein
MPISLSKAHRKLLENTTGEARVLAESACSAALENLAVHEKDYRGHMTVEQRLLRNRLRARGRALGDKRDERTGIQGIHHLMELAAYEHWHRLLFTRFLTENHLLITDEANGSVPITLEDCDDLAPELGARDGFDLACRFASLTLPGVFRRDDPVLELPIAMNDQVELRELLAALPAECFVADDGLGWTYQFWQAQRKKEVNDSGKKIGADELSPVTQLFTEDYMVEFLLHNTLGAWWAGKLGPIQADSEEEARAYAALPACDGVPGIVWTYLRFAQDETSKTWLPAAGTYGGWPKTANLIRLLDPCMGSGHFLVFALPLLVRLRMEEENLKPKAAVVAVLSDNIHGLELDERCTQIAAFNVALTAWKLAGYQVLPSLHLACSGLAPSATEAEWLALAGDDNRLRNGMVRLHGLFMDAAVLGSLINPHSVAGDLLVAAFHELQPVLKKALLTEAKDDTAHEMAVTAYGLACAAEILGSHFTLVATNVPYLGRGKQCKTLMDYCEEFHPKAKSDLATCVVERCLEFCAYGGSAALVTPQSWLFQATYSSFRTRLLADKCWDALARLGANSFQDMNWWAALTLLSIYTNLTPTTSHRTSTFDVSSEAEPIQKSMALATTPLAQISQNGQLSNPEAVIIFEENTNISRLVEFGKCIQGILPADRSRLVRLFWETSALPEGWEFFQGSDVATHPSNGRYQVLNYAYFKENFAEIGGRLQGLRAFGKKGVSVSKMNALTVTLYSGKPFDGNAHAFVVTDEEKLPAIWCFFSSEAFGVEVRKVDQKVDVTNSSIDKVAFDFEHWKKVAAEKYPNGLPKPFSNDPTQWLFNGHPKGSDQPLHVAVARLLGYKWPRQTGSSFPDCPALGPDGLEAFANSDGIVCLPPVNREQPAANRLRQLLAAALGALDERSLIAAAGLKGSKSKTLEDWLRDEFFEQHAKLFHDRPFIWHLWDGRSDGFHALVNYHKLDNAALKKLTYSYLGDWIQQQDIDAKADKPSAAERLGAARALQAKLAAILEGEAPLDIFVRWKPIKDQAQGWNPDLNDGIRQNIRPFLLAGDVGKRGAGLFRTVPLKLKDDDRGTEPHRPKEEYPWFWCEDESGSDPDVGKEFVGKRWNNVHLTLEKKRRSKA